MSKLTYVAAILAALSVPALADTNAQMLRQNASRRANRHRLVQARRL